MAAGQPPNPAQQNVQDNGQHRNHEGAREHLGIVACRIARDQQPTKAFT
jgi:hypothetical protein